VSKIIESPRGDLAALHEAGAIGKVTMREFDAIYPPPVREFGTADIKRLREDLRFSQPVFAHHLLTTVSTVQCSHGGVMNSMSSWRSPASMCAKMARSYTPTRQRRSMPRVPMRDDSKPRWKAAPSTWKC
jgi:putative transcriptional regulator